jgi:methyl-accepting chemotaxis protein
MMQRPPIASGSAFRARYTAWASTPGTLGALLIVGYFAAILDLGADGWRAFGAAIACLLVVAIPYGQWMQRRIDRDIATALDHIALGTQTPRELQLAYVAARQLPQRGMLVQVSNYLAAAFWCPLWMWFAVPGVPAFTLIVMGVGALTGGAACGPFCVWAMQRFIAPTRDYFAAQLSPAERQALVPVGSLTLKLALPVVATSVATVAFLALLVYAVTMDVLERHDLRLKAAFLESSARGLNAKRGSLADVVERGTRRGVATAVDVIDPQRPADPDSPLGLSERELAWIRNAGPGVSSSVGLDSNLSFAWRALEHTPGRVLVAASPVGALAGDLSSALVVVAVGLTGVAAVSLAAVLLVAGDVRRTTARLRAEAERVGAGDLSPGAPIESDDELGAVAHSFAAMAEALGGMLQRSLDTAARVDAAASGLASIGLAVREATSAQVKGIEQVSAAVSVVSRQATDITGSTQGLIGSVEEASSSVLELGAASEELSQTTVALGAQVEAVGSSIEQMVRSVAETGEASDALGSAVVETSSFVAEMVRSMRSVDSHALETARLSTRVIELADGGRDRVRETIAGMEVIRDASDSANRVIGGLAERMHEIGAIVDVIDDVADETNLLALNAAIIAAQAGEQGRAFSVVADEIKDLADRVLASTKEIGGLIRSVQGEAASAAEAIRAGTDSVQGGVDLSAQAGVALEEITSAARHSGERIQEIVQAVREQTRAATHVERLIEGVGTRVEQIRAAGREQGRGNEVVMRGSLVMRDVAHQTQRTTEEQARGALRIRDSIESVREAVDRIHDSLQQQSASCDSAGGSLGRVFERTRTNHEATDRLAQAAASLQALAETLREDLRKFRVA